MKVSNSFKTACLLMLVLFLMSSSQASAEQQERGIVGDWEIRIDFGALEMPVIVSFSQDREGNLGGKWINFWGVSELREISYRENRLSFAQEPPSDGDEFSSSFTGVIQQGKLSGTLSSERGQFEVKGKRLRRMPMVMGNWEMKFKIGERDITTMLNVRKNEAGKLAADWQSQWGEHQIRDVEFKRGKLTFQRKSKIQDQEFESTFEGTVKGHKLSGVVKTEWGDITAEGTRVGAALVGLWELSIQSETGDGRQFLRVNPDLSAMFGPAAIKNVELDGNKVIFKTELVISGRKIEISFSGRLDGKKLSGELTDFGGSHQVTGKKVRNSSAMQRATGIWKPSVNADSGDV